MVAWAIHCHGVCFLLHYLDDYLFLGKPGMLEAPHAATLANEVFSQAGIPVAAQKTEGPASSVTFLGILVDTNLLQLRLPVDKLTRLQALVSAWCSRRSYTCKELESFISHLVHAPTVIRPSKIFLQNLFALLSITPKPHHFVRLNASVRADLQWWLCFLQD